MTEDERRPPSYENECLTESNSKQVLYQRNKGQMPDGFNFRIQKDKNNILQDYHELSS
jgi:hypothetical protein